MHLETLLTLLVCLCRFTEESSQTLHVDPSKNGYVGIVVALPPDVTDQRTRDSLVTQIKDVFQEASKELFHATDKRLHFSSVTLLYPHSWSTRHPYRELESYGDADVLVFTGTGIAGTSPYTLQHGGCGQHGHQIYLPEGFLYDNNQENRGKAFLHEWSHYRYGVFEERGFPGDSRYPVFYRVSGSSEEAEVLLNDCSNVPLNYSLVNASNAACELEWYDNNTVVENGCHLDQTSLLQNTGVTSSLMSMPLISNVKEYCRKEVHNIHSPTKHNIMCNYQDVWTVIAESLEVPSKPPHNIPTLPRTDFLEVQEGKLRIAVLYSCYDPKLVAFATFRTALKRFIEESLPDGIRVSILGYTVGEQDLNVTSLELQTMQDRTDLVKKIELRRVGGGETMPNVDRALQHLIEELEKKKHLTRNYSRFSDKWDNDFK